MRHCASLIVCGCVAAFVATAAAAALLADEPGPGPRPVVPIAAWAARAYAATDVPCHWTCDDAAWNADDGCDGGCGPADADCAAATDAVPLFDRARKRQLDDELFRVARLLDSSGASLDGVRRARMSVRAALAATLDAMRATAVSTPTLEREMTAQCDTMAEDATRALRDLEHVRRALAGAAGTLRALRTPERCYAKE